MDIGDGKCVTPQNPFMLVYSGVYNRSYTSGIIMLLKLSEPPIESVKLVASFETGQTIENIFNSDYSKKLLEARAIQSLSATCSSMSRKT